MAHININPYITYTHNIGRIGGGVALLIKPHITHSKINHRFDGDTIAIKIETTLGPIIVAVNYSPPRRRYLPMADLNWLARHQTPVYLLGDLNARHTTFCTDTTYYGHALYNNWLREGRLRRIGPPTGTFLGRRGGLTKPDIILTHSRTYHYSHPSTLPFNVSDHAPMCLEISARAIKIPSPEFELTAKADWIRFKEILKEKFPPINFNLKEFEYVERYIEYLIKSVNEAQDIAIPKSTFKYSTRYCTSAKFKRLEKVLAEIHKLITLNAHNPVILNYLQTNKSKIIEQIKQEAKIIHAKNWEKHIKKLDKERKLDPKKFWSGINPILNKSANKSRILVTDTKTPDGTVLTNFEEIEDSMRTEWETHFIDPPEDRIHPDSLIENREFFEDYPDTATPYPIINISRLNPDSPIIRPIRPLETYKTFKSFRNKAPGKSKIRKPHVMHFPKILFVIITQIFNYCLATGKYPESFKTGIMIFIPKPGKDHSDPKNYRPITLLDIIAKCFGKIINQRFVDYLVANSLLNPLQYGFRKGRSCVSSLALMYEFIARSKGTNFHHKVSVVSRDISGAFDRVWHSKLIELIAKLHPELPSLFVKLLASFLHNRKIRIKINSYIGPSFTPSAGVPQGAPESPDIFNITTLPFDDYEPLRHTYAPWYCDDLHMIVATPCGPRNRRRHPYDLNDAIVNQNIFESKRGILTCPEKSIITTIGGGTYRPFEVDDGTEYPRLAKGATTKILGLHITNYSFTSRHVKECVTKAKTYLLHMYCLSHLSISTKLTLVKAYIITTLTYPVIPLNTASISCLYQLQTVQNLALRWVYQARYPQMVTNKELHEKAKIAPINIVIHTRAKTIWDKIRAGEAGDLDTFEWITDIRFRQYYKHFPSSLNIASRRIDPPPLYNIEDTRSIRAQRYYCHQVDDPP